MHRNQKVAEFLFDLDQKGEHERTCCWKLQPMSALGQKRTFSNVRRMSALSHANIKSLHWRGPEVESDGKDRVDQ